MEVSPRAGASPAYPAAVTPAAAPAPAPAPESQVAALPPVDDNPDQLMGLNRNGLTAVLGAPAAGGAAGEQGYEKHER